MKKVDLSMPYKVFAKLAIILPRRHASLLIQLCSGHAPLNKHLHRIGNGLTAGSKGLNRVRLPNAKDLQSLEKKTGSKT